jgi:hypothetical protein
MQVQRENECCFIETKYRYILHHMHTLYEQVPKFFEGIQQMDVLYHLAQNSMHWQ